jgi:hypothetical protein
LRNLLATQPSGLAMGLMSKGYSASTARIATRHNLIRRGDLDASPEVERQLVYDFILRNDAQNYMVLGDPAARVRIPTSSPAGGIQ